ncbi:MAG: hypothetical protein ACI4TK_05225 [Agathobacter sp.]
MKDIISIGDFLSDYSFMELFMFAIIIVLAIKEGISLFDWIKLRFHRVSKKTYEEKRGKEKIEEEFKIVDDEYAEADARLKKLEELVEMLTESDKEDIKAFITAQHHKFVYEQKWIDDYSMDCLEKRFSIYRREHGNTFILGFMDELRTLPKHPPADVVHNYAKTAEYVKKANNK